VKPPRALCVLLGAACAAFAVVANVLDGYDDPVALAGAVLIGATLGTARSHPRASWVVAAAAFTASGLVGGVSFAVGGVLVPAHAFCAARWDSRQAGITALVVFVAAGEIGSAILETNSPVPALMLPAAAWLAGRALREREEVARKLAERARELDEEREAHAALSVRYERARIASELHDIVAHAISVMVVQASAGQRIAAHDPEATAETFEAIADAARQAEEDMARLVTLLGDERPLGPAPDLALVEELVARAAGSGLDVTLRLEGHREDLPADVGHAAFRVVQEGLTNALRYASGAAVTVLVRGEREAVVVEVENARPPGDGSAEDALAGAGTGHGLIGLRERVAAVGGTLDAGPTTSGGWRLSARLSRLIPVG
jgi:signal transduction histidine kinase